MHTCERCVALDEMVTVLLKELTALRRKHAPKIARGSAPPVVTWLTPYFDAWTAAYGGKPNGGRLAKTLKPLHDEHGPDETLRRWANYLAGTDAKFASPSRFAETFGAWTGETPSSEKEDRYLADVLADASLDGYANMGHQP